MPWCLAGALFHYDKSGKNKMFISLHLQFVQTHFGFADMRVLILQKKMFRRPFTFKKLKYLPQDISKRCTTVLNTSSRHNWIIETLSCFILYFLHTAAEFWNRKRYSILPNNFRPQMIFPQLCWWETFNLGMFDTSKHSWCSLETLVCNI